MKQQVQTRKFENGSNTQPTQTTPVRETEELISQFYLKISRYLPRVQYLQFK